MTANKEFVFIRFTDHAGKKGAFYAVKLGTRRYRRVSQDGQYGFGGKDIYFMGTPDSEERCHMSKQYAELEKTN